MSIINGDFFVERIMVSDFMIAVFSGFNQRAVISFLRTLEKNRIQQYVIIATGNQDPILKTSYSNKVFCIRRERELELGEIKQIFRDLYRQCRENIWIAPSTEALNRFLLKHRAEFEEMHCIIPLVSEELYAKISDKESFWQICGKAGLTVPKKLLPKQVFTGPVVAKPKKYISDSGKIYSPFLLMDEEKYFCFLDHYNTKDFDIQQYIEGESYYLLYYISKQGEVFSLSQKNLLQQPDGKSILAACVADIHYEKIRKEYQKMFLSQGFFGLVMVELRKNKEEYYMIEANPRFWGPSQLFCDYGYNFFEFLLYDYRLLDDFSIEKKNVDAKYYWGGGMKGHPELCIKHIDDDQLLDNGLQDFERWDIYNREDTREIYRLEMRNDK